MSKADIGNDADVLEKDCEIIEFMLENCNIEIPDGNRFFASMYYDSMLHVFWTRADNFKQEIDALGLREGENAMAHTGILDFSHTNPEWESLMSLGIYGIRERAANYLEKEADEKKKRFYRCVVRVYDAALSFMKRVSVKAKEMGKCEMAESLERLTVSAPSSLYEAMQTSIVYYMLQHFFECTYLRTLGRLDSIYYPFFKNENKEEAEKLLYDFYREIDKLRAPSNIPFAIGGTDKDGNCLINELSYLFLDVYRKAGTTNTKFHVICTSDTPQDLIKNALDAVREGNNSIVFMNDEIITRSLLKLGAKHEDAVNYHIVGCYECGADGELTCSTNARVNLAKALELAINCGRDMQTGKLIGLINDGIFNGFDELYTEYIRQVRYLCKNAMASTNAWESHYGKIHSSPFLSGTYTSAMERGGDLYCDYTAKYNNSSVNAIGLATAVDSLVAIRKLVYEDRKMTLPELVTVLKNDWDGYEPLRLLIKNRYPKYGNADPTVDTLASDIVKKLSCEVSGKPNAKGGKFRLGLFSINWRWDLGEKTAASADGRKNGETLSQNSSATFGADKNGATAHLLSACVIDGTNTPNAHIVDLDLHVSAVAGENGLNAMNTALMTFFEMGGFGVHYNVLNTEVLKKAKEDPSAYPNLQVRLCGWNVLFSSLSEKEKDEFISRSVR